jgi:hypothetical protein
MDLSAMITVYRAIAQFAAICAEELIECHRDLAG